MATGDRSRVALLERGVPWGPNARSKPSYKLYFEVVLGSIALDKATDELVKVFGEDEERSRPDGKKAAIGSILIDKEGFVLEDKGVAVSSFAWALKPALDLKLGSLGNWPNVEPRIIEHLDRMVRRHNEDGEPIPIDWMSFLTLINGLCLSSVYPSIWLSHPHSRLRCFIISRPRRRLNLRY
jgi:hypothetical protein